MHIFFFRFTFLLITWLLSHIASQQQQQTKIKLFSSRSWLWMASIIWRGSWLAKIIRIKKRWYMISKAVYVAHWIIKIWDSMLKHLWSTYSFGSVQFSHDFTGCFTFERQSVNPEYSLTRREKKNCTTYVHGRKGSYFCLPRLALFRVSQLTSDRGTPSIQTSFM